MGSYDGAETCELVGLYILSQLQNLGISIGIYRDDGLAACNKKPSEVEKIKKNICKIFRENGLRITIEANLATVDFLDITMNLKSASYKPYMKPNNTPLYINKNSNHPPNIIKNIPSSINRRLSAISSNNNNFKQSTAPYQEALTKSGYQHELKYKIEEQINNKSNSKTRKRKTIWYNPPYSQNVTTNIGKTFLKIIDKCFPPQHKLHKIINKNNVKISYCCMSNIKTIIAKHNKNLINKNAPHDTSTNNTKTCNCRNNNCPLAGNCLQKEIIYQATVTIEDTNKSDTYIGLTATDFKTRYRNHISSFNNKKLRNSTALSKHIWNLKDRNITYNITWKTITKSKQYSTTTNTCNLCLKEKFYIICKPEMATLNNRNELSTECPHKKKFLLAYQYPT